MEDIEFDMVAKIPVRVRAVDDVDVELGDGATPTVLNDVFVFEAEISSNRLDSYYTHMDDSTLRNFARDAAAGVSLLDSHDGYKLGIGYSAGSRYEEEGDVARTVVTFYIVPGLRFGGQHSYASSDDYIRAIQGGVVRDVSVGFHAGRWICDVCNQRYFGQNTSCQHIAGYEYEIERDGEMVKQLCTVTIQEAHLSEVSLVFDGATPGAMILKAQQEAAAGRMSLADILHFEQQHRVKLPRPAPGPRVKAKNSRRATATDPVNPPSVHVEANGVNAMQEDEQVIEQEQEQEPEEVQVEVAVTGGEVVVETPAAVSGVEEQVDTEARSMVAAVRAAALESAAPQGISLDGAMRWLNEQLAQVTRQKDEALAEAARLQPLADQGRAYREELVNQAIAQGVRAMGEVFPEETYRAMLSGAPLEHIRQVRDTFASQGDERFPGGRLTRDLPAEEENKEVKRPAVPAAAYGAQ